MKNEYYILSSLVILLFIACKKPYPEIVDEAIFTCEEMESNFFFEGELNGERFCYHVGVNEYNMFLDRNTRLITSSPTINVGDTIIGGSGANAIFSIKPNPFTIDELEHHVQIESPVFPVETDLKTIIELSLKNGELPLTSYALDPSMGFNIKLIIPYDVKNEPPLAASRISSFFETFGGKQDNSHLEITELRIDDRGNSKAYIITFEFACDLYYLGNPEKHYGRLDNGIMRIGFTIEK